jgi:hypothetical protein
MRWPLTFYVKNKMKGFQGMTNGPVIRIVKSSKEDEGLYQHEWTHVKQWLVLPIIHSLLYRFNKKYRYKCELSAYKKQLKYSPGNENLFAEYICERYNLDVDKSKVLKDL